MQASNRRNDQTAHISLQISINVKERRRQKIQHRAISLARRQTSSPSLTTLPSFGGAVSRPITQNPQEQKQPNTQISSHNRRITLVSLSQRKPWAARERAGRRVIHRVAPPGGGIGAESGCDSPPAPTRSPHPAMKKARRRGGPSGICGRGAGYSGRTRTAPLSAEEANWA